MKCVGNKDRHVSLLAIDTSSDISIWLDTHSPDPIEEPTQRASVLLEELSAVPSNADKSTKPVWTVGYCGWDSELSGARYTDKDEKPCNMTHEEYNVRLQPWATQFDLLRAYYEVASMWNGHYRNVPPSQWTPSFEKLYKPNQRALAVGELHTATEAELQNCNRQRLSHSTTLKAQSELDTLSQCPPMATFEHHTISGFHGISGAMIATFIIADERLTPKVIGLCKFSPPYLIATCSDLSHSSGRAPEFVFQCVRGIYSGSARLDQGTYQESWVRRLLSET